MTLPGQGCPPQTPRMLLPWSHPGDAYGWAKPHFWGPRRIDSTQHFRKAKIPPGTQKAEGFP